MWAIWSLLHRLQAGLRLKRNPKLFVKRFGMRNSCAGTPGRLINYRLALVTFALQLYLRHTS
jgi:hypothetical protein